MEKPRQRITYPLIIDRPELKSPLRHLVEGSVTLALWAVWIYWLLPIVTLFLWFFGLKLFYKSIMMEIALFELIELLRNGGTVILVVIVLNTIWIFYNYQMIFKRKGDRRIQIRKCPDETVAKFFNVAPVVVEKAIKHNRIEVILSKEGTAVKI